MAKVLKKAMLDGALMHPGNFVSAVELKGRDVTVTIEKVERNELPREGSSKKDVLPVLSFIETPKKMVLNKTNASSIVTMYGAQAKEWVGKRITLYPTTTRFGADTVDCIRVREVVPPAKPAAKPSDNEPAQENAQ